MNKMKIYCYGSINILNVLMENKDWVGEMSNLNCRCSKTDNIFNITSPVLDTDTLSRLANITKSTLDNIAIMTRFDDKTNTINHAKLEGSVFVAYYEVGEFSIYNTVFIDAPGLENISGMDTVSLIGGKSNGTFINDDIELCYKILNLNGVDATSIGISSQLYANEGFARHWYDGIRKTIIESHNLGLDDETISLQNKALSRLEAIFDKMI